VEPVFHWRSEGSLVLSRIYVVKIGSNTLTDVQGCLRDDTLAGLVAEVAALAKGGDKVLLVSSGGDLLWPGPDTGQRPPD